MKMRIEIKKEDVADFFGCQKQEKFMEIDGRKHNFDFYPLKQHKNFQITVYTIDAVETLFEENGYDKTVGLKIDAVMRTFSSDAKVESIILTLRKWIRHYQMHIIPKKDYLDKLKISIEGKYMCFKVGANKVEDDEYIEIGGQKVKLTDELRTSLFRDGE